MVTSQKMSENEMGYRGSKSELQVLAQRQQPNVFSVKEQRVDGSYFGVISKLRCTLMGLERGYPIKYHSKQINQIRSFATCSTVLYPLSTTSYTVSNLDPWFITGFSDAEGCFTISIQANSKYKTG